MKLKQGLALGLIAVMSAALIACGGGSDEPKEPTATAGPVVKDAATILNDNKASVVDIRTTSPEGEGGGTGVVWEDSSHVLTNAHVVIGAGSIKVIDPAEGNRSFPARVVAMSPCDDVALLQVDRATGLKPATFGDSAKMKPGDKVVSLGFPATISSGPANPIVTEGSVSRMNASFAYSYGQRDLIQNTAPINPGNSGGPLFNQYGEVIGLNSYSARGRQAENYAISINEALLVGEELKKGKNIAYLGISLVQNYAELTEEWDLPYSNGLVITGVDPGGPAAKAQPEGLDYGYQIFRVNDTFVETVGQFCDILRSTNSGSTLRIRFGYWDANGMPFDNFVYEVVMP